MPTNIEIRDLLMRAPAGRHVAAVIAPLKREGRSIEVSAATAGDSRLPAIHYFGIYRHRLRRLRDQTTPFATTLRGAVADLENCQGRVNLVSLTTTLGRFSLFVSDDDRIVAAIHYPPLESE